MELEPAKSAFRRVLLLVDLDGPSATQTAWLAAKGLTARAANIFFMVQKMKAWFLAQPALLHTFYQPRLAHALPTTAPDLVRDPNHELERCTTGTRKGRYHKTGHGARLLAELQMVPPQTVFSDVRKLVKAL